MAPPKKQGSARTVKKKKDDAIPEEGDAEQGLLEDTPLPPSETETPLVDAGQGASEAADMDGGAGSLHSSLPEHMHPAVLGYTTSRTGRVYVDVAKIHPAMVGAIWVPEGGQDEPVQQAPLPLRDLRPFEVISSEGKFLEKEVWPTLEPALHKLFTALQFQLPSRKHMSPFDRITDPEEARGFNPIQWLASYLKRNNPNAPGGMSLERAATLIQAAWRAFLARRVVTRMREQAAHARVLGEDEAKRVRAATKIQAVFRGHSVRIALEVGQLSALARK